MLLYLAALSFFGGEQNPRFMRYNWHVIKCVYSKYIVWKNLVRYMYTAETVTTIKIVYLTHRKLFHAIPYVSPPSCCLPVCLLSVTNISSPGLGSCTQVILWCCLYFVSLHISKFTMFIISVSSPVLKFLLMSMTSHRNGTICLFNHLLVNVGSYPVFGYFK